MRSRDYVTAARMWSEGETGRDIAQALGLRPSEVYTAIKNNRELFPTRHRRFHHVTDAEKWRMVEMRVGGMSYRAIARELGREAQTVRRWCVRAGVA